jgi:hypothetical protein
VRAHPWLAQVPWTALVAFAIATAIARLRGDENWLSIGMFAYVTVLFYGAGRLVEIRAFQKKVDAIREADAMAALELCKLSLAYQCLHMRHFKMTGEIYGDAHDAPDRQRHDA